MSDRDCTAPVEYRPIPGYSGYRAGSDGSIWSNRRYGGRAHEKKVVDGEWRLMVGGLDHHGYRKTSICLGLGRQITRRSSVLVAEAFHGPRPEGMVCAHNNGDKTDDRPSNLRWTTQKDNMADKWLHGTQQAGAQSAKSKITAADAIAICREWDAGGATQVEIGAKYGIRGVSVCAIVTGRNWGHVTGRGKTRYESRNSGNAAVAEVLIERSREREGETMADVGDIGKFLADVEGLRQRAMSGDLAAIGTAIGAATELIEFMVEELAAANARADARADAAERERDWMLATMFSRTHLVSADGPIWDCNSVFYMIGDTPLDALRRAMSAEAATQPKGTGE